MTRWHGSWLNASEYYLLLTDYQLKKANSNHSVVVLGHAVQNQVVAK